MKISMYWMAIPLSLMIQACASPNPERTPDDARSLMPDAISRKLNAESEHEKLFTTLNPTRETLWQIYDRLPVYKITDENLIQLVSILQSAGTNGIVEVDGVSSHELGEPERNVITDWVYKGGTFWIRGNCSIEQSFGFDWQLLSKRGSGDNILIRSAIKEEVEQQIVIHPLTIGVDRIRMKINGHFVPRSEYAKEFFHVILQDDKGILFGELPLGKGAIILDSSMGARLLKAPFQGIYGFDSGSFWLNFFRHYGDLDNRIKTFNTKVPSE